MREENWPLECHSEGKNTWIKIRTMLLRSSELKPVRISGDLIEFQIKKAALRTFCQS